jgi:putative ABC transport system substrate-binding protein
VPDDPVKLGLVASLARPGGTATGVSFLLSDLGDKQLGLLHELVPTAKRFGLLVNPGNPNVEDITTVMKTSASVIGAQIIVSKARDTHEIEAAFTALLSAKAEALVVGTDPFFYSRRVHLATLATRPQFFATPHMSGCVHICDIATLWIDFRFRGKSGHAADIAG